MRKRVRIALGILLVSSTSFVHTRITVSLFFLCAVLTGCTSTRTEFALSTPQHDEDWQRMRTVLATAGIRCADGGSNLGTLSLLVASRDFARASHEALNLIARDSLTLRVRVSTGSWAYEVWESGKKVREETYVVEKAGEEP